jgi:hypothetical protein
MPEELRTALDQLARSNTGTRTLAMMIGAKSFAYSEKDMYVRFRHMPAGKYAGLGKDAGITELQYNIGRDDYTLSFFTSQGNNIKSFDSLYAEDLRKVFERETGLVVNMRAGSSALRMVQNMRYVPLMTLADFQDSDPEDYLDHMVLPFLLRRINQFATTLSTSSLMARTRIRPLAAGKVHGLVSFGNETWIDIVMQIKKVDSLTNKITYTLSGSAIGAEIDEMSRTVVDEHDGSINGLAKLLGAFGEEFGTTYASRQ